MGFIFILMILSLAIFICVSNTVFSLAAQMRPKNRLSGLQEKD